VSRGSTGRYARKRRCAPSSGPRAAPSAPTTSAAWGSGTRKATAALQTRGETPPACAARPRKSWTGAGCVIPTMATWSHTSGAPYIECCAWCDSRPRGRIPQEPPILSAVWCDSRPRGRIPQEPPILSAVCDVPLGHVVAYLRSPIY
jgi:hypothetical protein